VYGKMSLLRFGFSRERAKCAREEEINEEAGKRNVTMRN